MNNFENINNINELFSILYNKSDVDNEIRRYIRFKEIVSETLPELTLDEILKFYQNFQGMKDLFGFWEHTEMFTAIEFEQLKLKQ